MFPDTSNNKFELLGFDTFVSNYIVAKCTVANNGAPVSQYFYRGILIGILGMKGKKLTLRQCIDTMLKTMLTNLSF